MEYGVFEDARAVTGILIDGGTWRHVGELGLTKIEVVKECGEVGYVPWFALYNGDNLETRWNGKYVVGVSYHQPTSDHF